MVRLRSCKNTGQRVENAALLEVRKVRESNKRQIESGAQMWKALYKKSGAA